MLYMYSKRPPVKSKCPETGGVLRTFSPLNITSVITCCYFVGALICKQCSRKVIMCHISFGFQSRLCVWIVLNMLPCNSLLTMATVCSSWSSINVGTSKRSILLPEGNINLPYVARANAMMSRNSCLGFYVKYMCDIVWNVCTHVFEILYVLLRVYSYIYLK